MPSIILAAAEAHALPLPHFLYPAAIGAVLLVALVAALSWRDSGHRH